MKHVIWIEHAATLDLIGAPSRGMLEYALPKRTLQRSPHDIRAQNVKHTSPKQARNQNGHEDETIDLPSDYFNPYRMSAEPCDASVKQQQFHLH